MYFKMYTSSFSKFHKFDIISWITKYNCYLKYFATSSTSAFILTMLGHQVVNEFIWRNFCVQVVRIDLRNLALCQLLSLLPIIAEFEINFSDFSNIRLNILDITDLTLITTGTWAFFLFRRRCVVKTNSWWQNNKAVVFYSSPTFFHLNNDI